MVIVITGPVASGKSTIARGLARELERRHIRVAVIDLDLIFEMLATSEPDSEDAAWALARRAAAALANTFLEGGVAVVVADGSYNKPGHRADFAEHLDTRVGLRRATRPGACRGIRPSSVRTSPPSVTGSRPCR
jgi:predicted kinase